jgi:hypothetical protein
MCSKKALKYSKTLSAIHSKLKQTIEIQDDGRDARGLTQKYTYKRR